MALLDSTITEQLKQYFNNMSETITISAFLDDSEKSLELDGFLQEIDVISDKVNYVKNTFGENKELETTLEITRPTSFTLLKSDTKTGISFYGIPGGHEFNSFILAILGLAGIGKKLDDDKLAKIASISKELNVETFIALSCTHCPEVVQALNSIAINNKNIKSSMVDSVVYYDEAKAKDIQAVPVVFINGEMASVGAKTLDELIDLLASR
jgi:alkyl hydroperoxide reductase subunit F